MSKKSAAEEKKHPLDRAIALLGALFIIGLPLAVFPGHWEEFRASKALFAALVGTPLFALCVVRNRAFGDPCGIWRTGLLGFGLLALLHGLFVAPDSVLARFAPLFITLLAAIEFAAGRDLDTRQLKLLGASLLGVLLVGLPKHFLGWFGWIPGSDDVALAATIGNSNELAEFAAPLAVLLVLLPRRLGTWRPLLWAIPAGALVLLSQSRGGALAMGLGIGLGLLVDRLRGQRGVLPPLRARMLLGGLALALVAALAVPSLRARAATVFDAEHPTNRVRLEVWGATWDTFLDQPLTGSGLGVLESAIQKHRRPFEQVSEWDRIGAHTTIASPHQELLWFLAALGLLGALALVALVLRLATDARRAASDPRADGLFVPVIAALAATGLLALIRSPFHHASSVMVIGLLIGWLAHSTGRRGRHTHAATMIAGIAIVGLAALATLRDVSRDRDLAAWLAADRNLASGLSDPEQRARLANDAQNLGRHLDRLVGETPLALGWRRSARLVPELRDLVRLARACAREADLREDTEPALAERLRSLARALPTEADLRDLADAALSDFPAHAPTLREWSGALADLARDSGVSPADLMIVMRGSREGSGDASIRAIDELRTNLGSRLRWGREAGPQTPELAALEARWHLARGEHTSALLDLDAEIALLESAKVSASGARIERSRTALRMGHAAQSFGTFLAMKALDEIDLAPVRTLLGEGDAPGAVRELYGIVSRSGWQLEALQLLSEAGYAWPEDDQGSEAARADADLATARVRTHLAVDAAEQGDQRMFALHVRIARQKDPQLLDAQLLEAVRLHLAGRVREFQRMAGALERSGALDSTGMIDVAFAVENWTILKEDQREALLAALGQGD